MIEQDPAWKMGASQQFRDPRVTLLSNLLRQSRQSAAPQGPTDAYYRALVPKRLSANLEFRRRVLDLGYASQSNAEQLWIMCGRDILFYLNTFCWVASPLEFPDDPIRPFITWKFQDAGLLGIQRAISEQHDLTIPKSRDNTGTTLCLAVFEHRWHFLPGQSFLICSRTEDFVENGEDPKALFSRIDFTHRHQPRWLLPTDRWLGPKDPNRMPSKLLLKNADNGSTIVGSATVPNMARGAKLTGMLLDEHSQMANAESIESATAMAANCRIKNSTPMGRFGIGAAFYKSFANPSIRKLMMHWSEHPLHRRGLYKLQGGVKKPLPTDYDYRTDFPFVGDNRPRSPWYDTHCARLNHDKQKIAQELDIDFLGSVRRLAPEEVIALAEREDVRDPYYEGRVGVDQEDLTLVWLPEQGGPFKIWCPMGMDRPMPGEYALGADISWGVGSSDSALIIFNKVTGEQVAGFVINTMPPPAFARYCVAVCRWFHNAELIPETQGAPGQSFVDEMLKWNYWNVRMRESKMDGLRRTTMKVGVQNTDSGSTLLDGLLDGIRKRVAIIRWRLILQQLQEYDIDNGKVVHSSSAHSDDPADKQATHGDAAIAAACARLGIKKDKANDPLEVQDVTASLQRNPPVGSPEWRYRQRDREKLQLYHSDSDW